MRSLLVAAALASALAAASTACSRASDAPPPPAASASASPAVPKGTLALGERITSPIVPLTEIAKNPARYEDRVVATTGKVTSVCQEMGCWLELRDESGQAHVRMHGHTFFVPRTAPGHVARVQARVLKSAASEEECSEKGGAQQGLAKIELDATGVEID
jgi:hypothetical protein